MHCTKLAKVAIWFYIFVWLPPYLLILLLQGYMLGHAFHQIQQIPMLQNILKYQISTITKLGETNKKKVVADNERSGLFQCNHRRIWVGTHPKGGRESWEVARKKCILGKAKCGKLSVLKRNNEVLEEKDEELHLL